MTINRDKLYLVLDAEEFETMKPLVSAPEIQSIVHDNDIHAYKIFFHEKEDVDTFSDILCSTW